MCVCVCVCAHVCVTGKHIISTSIIIIIIDSHCNIVTKFAHWISLIHLCPPSLHCSQFWIGIRFLLPTFVSNLNDYEFVFPHITFFYRHLSFLYSERTKIFQPLIRLWPLIFSFFHVTLPMIFLFSFFFFYLTPRNVMLLNFANDVSVWRSVKADLYDSLLFGWGLISYVISFLVVVFCLRRLLYYLSVIYVFLRILGMIMWFIILLC